MRHIRGNLKLVIIYGIIIAATLLGFALSSFIGQRYIVLAGLGIVAYVFGLRHGVDADHIAAIDNTTRKLMHDGKNPISVGTWFSLGHSTIVMVMIVALILATRLVSGSIPALQNAGSIIGTAVSGGFLWVIGLINVAVVFDLYRAFKQTQSKGRDADIDGLLENRGFLSRYLGGLFKTINEPWQMYPVGVLFGLGFDTATEVGLMAISVGVGVTSAVPLWMPLILPLMFTCGMVLVDTTDGVMMNLAYGWAFIKPIRKIYYNLTITIISILVALAVGTIELLQVFASELGLGGVFWGWFATLDFETLGYWVIGLFVFSWVIAMAVYKYKGFDRITLSA